MTLIDLYFIIGLTIIGIGGAELIWRCKPKEERERLLKEAREKEEERKERRKAFWRKRNWENISSSDASYDFCLS